jgi:hypothetical protein
MREITVRKVSTLDDRALPVFAEMDRLMREIGRRAGVFAAARSYGAGDALDDCLRAEREVLAGGRTGRARQGFPAQHRASPRVTEVDHGDAARDHRRQQGAPTSEEGPAK